MRPDVDQDDVTVLDHQLKCNAIAHVAAVEQMNNLRPFEAINIGTGEGLSVLQMIKEFEKNQARPLDTKLDRVDREMQLQFGLMPLKHLIKLGLRQHVE